MKPRRDHSAKHATPAPPSEPPSWPERLRGVIAVLAIGLALAATLLPSEGAVREGTFAVLATCWCLLLVGWTALLFSAPIRTVRFGWTEIVGGLFVAWHSLSALAWLGHGNDRQTLNALWMVVGYGLTVLLLRQMITNARLARVMLALMLWLAATLAATGYVQYFVTMPMLRAAYKDDPQRVLDEHGISGDADSPQRILFENRLQSVEPLATFALTNSLAGFIAPWLIVALAIGLATLGDSELRRPLLAAALLAAFLAGCLLLTKSRTAVLAVMAGLALLALYGRRSDAGDGLRHGWQIGWRIPAMAAAALVVIGLGAVVVGGLDAEVLSEAPKSVLYRLEYWRSTGAMIADYPLLGCGPGSFQGTYAAYKLPQASEMVADPHNFLLEVWATAGTPAIVLLLVMFAALAVDLSRIASRQTQTEPLEVTPQGAQEPSPKAATLYYGGGLMGLVLGFVLAALGGFPLDTLGDMPVPIVWWVGLLLLPVVWWSLSPWLDRGQLPIGAAIVALLVLAINLLAAGALAFPGVIVTALVLLPVATELGAYHRDASDGLPRETRISRGVAGALCLASFGLAVLSLWTEYRPVLTSRMQVKSAIDRLLAGEPAAAEQAALAAAASDPWAPEPWRLVAEIRFQRFMAEPTAANWSEFTAAAEQFRQHNPRHHAQFFQRGNWHFLAWQRGHRVSVLQGDRGQGVTAEQQRRLAEALAAYQEAIHRYPNSALYHGQLAWALEAAGQHAAAREAADRAKSLDDAMPHADQKLARRRIADWQPASARPTFQRPETAELTIEKLRTTTSTRPGEPS